MLDLGEGIKVYEPYTLYNCYAQLTDDMLTNGPFWYSDGYNNGDVYVGATLYEGDGDDPDLENDPEITSQTIAVWAHNSTEGEFARATITLDANGQVTSWTACS